MSSYITLDDRKFIEPLLKKWGGFLSESSFANLYLFRKAHDYRLCGEVIQAKTYEGRAFSIPLEFPFNFKAGETYFPIPDELIAPYQNEKFKIEAFESDEDYLFDASKLKTLAGKKLASRRNLLYRFEEDYEPEVRPLDKAGARSVLEAWSHLKRRKADEEACYEAIELLDALGLEGITLFSGNKAVAFLIAERYRDDAVLFHFAKALPEVKGATAFLYRAMANRLPDEVKWINMEQDLGLEGLKKAKSAFQPDRMLKKWFITPAFHI
jgi:hypothetical protein